MPMFRELKLLRQESRSRISIDQITAVCVHAALIELPAVEVNKPDANSLMGLKPLPGRAVWLFAKATYCCRSSLITYCPLY